MAEYYVDYVGGADSNNGTATGTPWKHCPGDSNATGTPGGTTLAAGDTVNFKGGVRYEGEIIVTANGTSGSPITFQGSPSGWGTGKALVDGSVEITNTWTQCTSSAQVNGNANYASIWFCDETFVGQTHWHTIIKDDAEFLPFSQGQGFTPAAPYLWDTVHDGWTELTSSGNITTTNMTDVTNFTSSDSAYYDECWLSVWVQGNGVADSLITAFNPSTDTITYDLTGSSFYATSKYTIANNRADISYAGEYSHYGDKIYMWPVDDENPNTQTLRTASLNYGFWVQGKDYITVDGFAIQGAYSPPGGGYGAHGVVLTSGPKDGLVVTNNEMRFMRSVDLGPVIYAISANNSEFSNNIVKECLRSRGSIISGTNVTISGNSVSNVGGTGIFCAGVASSTLSDNTISGIKGVHGNGVSLYLGSTNTVFERNYIYDCGSPLTYEESSNLTFKNNIIDTTAGDANEWGGMTGYVHWFNNSFVGDGVVVIRFWDGASLATYRVENNIYAEAAPVDAEYTEVQYNIWGLAGTEYNNNIVETDLANIFTNYAGGDYTLINEGTAVDAGKNLSADGVLEDYAELSRPQGADWDIGAYEFIQIANNNPKTGGRSAMLAMMV